MEIKKILKDIKSVNEILDFSHKSVTIFGSARFDGRNHYAKEARRVASEFAKMGYTQRAELYAKDKALYDSLIGKTQS